MEYTDYEKRVKSLFAMGRTITKLFKLSAAEKRTASAELMISANKYCNKAALLKKAEEEVAKAEKELSEAKEYRDRIEALLKLCENEFFENELFEMLKEVNKNGAFQS